MIVVDHASIFYSCSFVQPAKFYLVNDTIIIPSPYPKQAPVIIVRSFLYPVIPFIAIALYNILRKGISELASKSKTSISEASCA